MALPCTCRMTGLGVFAAAVEISAPGGQLAHGTMALTHPCRLAKP